MSLISIDTGRLLLRRAADYYGSEALAHDLGVSARALYRWMDGSRQPRSWPAVLTRTRVLVTDRRAQLGMLAQALRALEGMA